MRSTWIRHPAFDLGLLGFAWVPFYVWVAFGLGMGRGDLGGDALGDRAFRQALAFATVVALGITYVHRHYTLLVVYGDPSVLATRQRAFLWTPVLVFGLMIAGRLAKGFDLGTSAGQHLTPWFVILVASGIWNIWHTVQQRYGILRVYAGRAAGGLESRDQARRDRALVWAAVAAVAALVLLIRPQSLMLHAGAALSMKTVGRLLARREITAGLAVIPLVAGGVFAWWLDGERRARLTLRERAPRLAFVASTALLLAVFVLHGPVLGYLVFGVAHALEYVAFVHHFGARKFEGRADRSVAALLLRRPLVVAPLVIGALVAAYAVSSPSSGTDAYLAYYFGTTFLHFLYDGWIWKVRRPEVAAPLGVSPPSSASLSGSTPTPRAA